MIQKPQVSKRILKMIEGHGYYPIWYRKKRSKDPSLSYSELLVFLWLLYIFLVYPPPPFCSYIFASPS